MKSSISQTKALLNEAEAVLQRIARNRAAMTRPANITPAYVEVAPPSTRPQHPTSTQFDAPRGRALSEAEYAALATSLERRGFIVNADIRIVVGLTMASASQRLRQFCEAGILRREGAGTKSRYYAGDKWPAGKTPIASAEPNGLQIRAALDVDVPALVQLAVRSSQRRYTIKSGALSKTDDEVASFFGKQIRSTRTLVLLAKSANAAVVGYICAGFERNVPGKPTGFIRDLALADHADGEDLGSRLVAAAIGWFTYQGANDIRVQALPSDEGAQKLFEKNGFRAAVVEMQLVRE